MFFIILTRKKKFSTLSHPWTPPHLISNITVTAVARNAQFLFTTNDFRPVCCCKSVYVCMFLEAKRQTVFFFLAPECLLYTIVVIINLQVNYPITAMCSIHPVNLSFTLLLSLMLVSLASHAKSLVKSHKAPPLFQINFIN